MVEGANELSAKPPLPQLRSSRSMTATPSRRTRDRQAVGFTNRPSSEQSSRSSTQMSARSSSSQGYRGGQRAPGSSDSRRPPLPARQFAGTMAGKLWEDRDLASKVREKILKRRVNVAPVLKEKAVNGYVSSSDMRDALRKLKIPLNEEETAFCAGAQHGEPDDYVDVRNFVDALRVPDFLDYDPMGQSKARESKSLKRLAFPPRPRPDQGMEGLEQTEEFHTTEGLNSPAKDSSRRPTGSASVGGTNVQGNEAKPRVLLNKRQARRHVKSLSAKLKEYGVSVLEMFRNIDHDGSGVIEKEEFEAELKKRTDLGVLQPQIDDVWSYIDKDGNNSINYLELVGALEDDATSSKNSSRPATGSRPGSKGSEDSGQRMSFGDPWAQGRGKRQAILPSDHFNVRTWRGQPPRATETILVPIEESFLHCPQWMQYSAVTLNNNWLMECTGQGKVQKTREAARLERKRQSWSRVDNLVAEREQKAQDLDAARISGLCRTRLQWMEGLKGPWA